jgi:hypothetical protein
VNSMCGRLTENEIDRAIYLDLEGKAPSRLTGESFSPTLAGWVEEGVYHHVVFDRRLECAAMRRSGRYQPVAEFAASLRMQARDEHRRIVHWTRAEADHFASLDQPLGGLAFDLRGPTKARRPQLFKASKQAIRDLKNAPKYKRPSLRRLAHGLCVQCAEAEGFQVKTHYGWGQVGQFIRECEAQSDRAWADWSPSTKRKWRRLLYHNETDCRAMITLASALLTS